jgi:serine/threonine protein kinase
LSGDLIKIGDLGEIRLKGPISLALKFKGTVPYMSPELASSEGYTFTTDIWSAGCILYEMLTLEFAFATNNPVVLLRLIDGEDIIDKAKISYLYKKILKA